MILAAKQKIFVAAQPERATANKCVSKTADNKMLAIARKGWFVQ
jgi:hypothetical protein